MFISINHFDQKSELTKTICQFHQFPDYQKVCELKQALQINQFPPGRAKVFPLLMSRMKEQGAGSSLCYTQSLCHWWKSPPTGICMTASWNQICFPHIQPSSACKQLDFSLLLHLNFKNLETVNIELSAPELILFLAPTIKLPVCKAKT